MKYAPDIKRILENMSYVLRGGTITDGHQNWTLVWPYGWWRVWLGDVTKLREGDGQRWVTDFADKIMFTVLSYARPCPETAKIAQKVEEEPMDIAKVLGNMSALLRGRRLTVTVNGEQRVYFYDAVNSSLHYEMPAVIMKPGEQPQPSTYVCGAPNMAFSEVIAILTTGEVNAG